MPWAFLVPLLPALAFVFIGLYGTRLRSLEWGGWVAVAASFVGMLLAVLIAAAEMLGPGQYVDRSFTWLQVPASGSTFPNGVSLVMGTLVDPVSALMLVVVNVVGFLVLLYSIGYMHQDKGLPRYYAELSLFLAAMNGLVLSDNLLEFFLFWELVGVCSYFLIGFYYEKPSAASAAKEAFLVTRVGDVLFLLGIFIYFSTYAMAGSGSGWAASGFKFVSGNEPFLGTAVAGANSTLLTVAGLMMLAGAAGKSAQFPLHVWLPDAMEGPTTVSALIHAATMVAAGVYLLAVTSLFLGFTPDDQLAIVAIGGFTTFFAATMAVVHTDIKRVIAYSTISQLGYMVLAVGAGFTMVGMFHLFTHAFFKALLFLAAGSVIHAVGTQDLFKMGGLRKAMPVTYAAFAVGSLSLVGVPGFAGFFSKDDVLASVYSQTGAHPLYWPFLILAFAGVFLTAYYIFRAFFLAFHGDRVRDVTLPHPHEGPWVMQVPLIVLSVLAVVGGLLIFVPSFQHLLAVPSTSLLLVGANIPPTYGTPAELAITALSVGLGFAGIGLAYALWGNGRVFELSPASPAQPVRRLSIHLYYFKDGYDWIGAKGVYTISRAADFVDRFVLDGAVRGMERAFAKLSNETRRLQTGVVSDYAAYVIAGLVGFLVLLLYVAPWVASAWGGSWSMFPLLSFLLATLVLGTLATFLAGRSARWVALATSVAFLLEASYLLSGYTQWPNPGPGGVPGFADIEQHAWISLPWLSINYSVGVDGISLVLILLTAFLQLATVVYSWNEPKEPAAWFGLVLLTCLGCFGVFIALDILLFFLFWEAVLVPMFFMIGYWGGVRRRYAALKFFVYTHVASVVMLVSLFALAFYSHAASFDFADVYLAARVPGALSISVQVVLFLGLFFGFGVKFPIVPFHTWLPDAHVEAPTGGSVLLAGLLLKLGGYGLIRWAVELLPQAMGHVQWLLYAVAFLSIVWGSVVSLAQRDLKRLVAFSSINHMGIVLLAIAVNSSLGLTAAVLLMFAHGVVSGLLFMVSGSVHHTFGTRDVATLGGITPRTPVLSTMVMVGALASLGLPALVGFPAEFTALLATWAAIGYWVLIPLVMLVVTAAFYIWMMQRVLFGPEKGIPDSAHDLPAYEASAMAMLVALTVLYGILPGLLVNVIVNSPIKAWP